MKLLHKKAYQKKAPWRDASLIFVVCEGKQREPDYFSFFHQLDSRLKLIIIPSTNGKSAPLHMLENAQNAVEKQNPDQGSYSLYIVMDTDRWTKGQIQQVWKECSKIPDWNLALSNPCFEVWLYFHGNKKLPDAVAKNCKEWKGLVNQVFPGGFNSNKHPALIGSAIENAQANYSEKGFEPSPGSTQVFNLGKTIFELTKNKLMQQ